MQEQSLEQSEATSHQNIYNEIYWPLLPERRKNCKLKFMYKVMHHCAPPYLTDLIPNRVRDIVDHNLRNKDDFRNNRRRTEKYKHSIFMDGIRLWNNLPGDIKDLDSSLLRTLAKEAMFLVALVSLPVCLFVTSLAKEVMFLIALISLSVCLFVCLCLSVDNITQKVMNGFG